MGRNLFIVVSDDSEVISKARSWGVQNNVTVNAYTNQQWNEGLHNPTFRSQVATGTVALTTGGTGNAKVFAFPSRESAAASSASVQTMNQMESEAILNAIAQYNGNLTEAAKALGIGRATIYRKIKLYNIDPSKARGRGTQEAA